MKTASNTIKEQYFTEQELAQFISDSNVSDFKFHLDTYCSYKGLVTLPITAEQSDEHLFLLKSQDKEAEKALIQILISFFTALSNSMPKPVSIKLSDSISIPVNPKLSNSIWIPENPTFAEAIAIFEKPKFRKQLQKLIMKTQNNHLDNGIYSSRAFSSFENLLLAFDKNERLKLGHNTLDIQLIGSDSWVADIIHLYKESSDLLKTTKVDGVIKLLEKNSAPKTGDRVSIELDSNSDIEGETVYLQSSLSNIEYLYLKLECENKANQLGINTNHSAFDNTDKSSNYPYKKGADKLGVTHPTKIPHLNTITSLSDAAVGKGLTGSPQSDAEQIMNKFTQHQIKSPVEKEALANYLTRKGVDKELGGKSKNSFNSLIKALCLVITDSNPDTCPKKVIEKLESKNIKYPVAYEELLDFLKKAPELCFHKS